MYKNNYIDAAKDFFKKIADEKPNSYFITMDGMETFWCEEIKKKYPDRVIQCGISEQNALSIASGLALTGKLVYVFMLGMYSYCRAFDQLKLDIGYNNANVKIIAHGSGLWGTAGGYSHIGVEDLALLRSVPNLKILTPLLKNEWEYYLDYTANNKGPMFLRIDFAYEGAEFNDSIKSVEFNKLVKFVSGDICTIIAYGTSIAWAKELRKNLGPIEILYATSIEPFDYESLQKIISQKQPIITIEEHGKGGLASIVSEQIAKSGIKVPFFPIYIDKKEFNFTGSTSHFFYKLSNFNSVLNDLKKYYSKQKILKRHFIFTKTVNLGGKSKNKMDINYCIIGIPIVTKRCSNKDEKYLLFKFLPIYKKGENDEILL